jgi:NAD(P)-dependent dehydrogenase (short-subunit alcohol dehydrogenase family)
MSNKKVAIITGASTGIGRAAAIKFAEEKFYLTLVARNDEELSKLARELESRYSIECIVCAGNLNDKIFLRSIIDKTVEKWQTIDVLVNNAAWRTIETMRSISFETWEQTMGVCLTAPAFLAKWTAEVMENNRNKGIIINVSSVMSGRAGGISPAYIAAKGAIESLTYELAVTYGRSDIRVVCVQPGNIETNMSTDYIDPKGQNISGKLAEHVTDLTPLSRAGMPEEIAGAIYWLSTDNASFITGTTLMIDGGLSHNFNAYSMKKIQFPNEF